MSHTPTPWTLTESGQINTADNERRVTSPGFDLSREDAEHIVRCVNAHDELVAFVTRVAGAFPQGHRAPLGDDARAILAKVIS